MMNKHFSNVVYDLSKVKPDNIDLKEFYSTIEPIKDGKFVNTKYESQQVITAIPHLIVFSNDLPKLDYLSKDKWKIMRIKESTKELHICNNDEIEDLSKAINEFRYRRNNDRLFIAQENLVDQTYNQFISDFNIESPDFATQASFDFYKLDKTKREFAKHSETDESPENVMLYAQCRRFVKFGIAFDKKYKAWFNYEAYRSNKRKITYMIDEKAIFDVNTFQLPIEFTLKYGN